MAWTVFSILSDYLHFDLEKEMNILSHSESAHKIGTPPTHTLMHALYTHTHPQRTYWTYTYTHTNTHTRRYVLASIYIYIYLWSTIHIREHTFIHIHLTLCTTTPKVHSVMLTFIFADKEKLVCISKTKGSPHMTSLMNRWKFRAAFRKPNSIFVNSNNPVLWRLFWVYPP